MLRIAFEQPKTALEIRDPLIAACRDAAEEQQLYACFQQCQQPVFAKNELGYKTKVRIGKYQHKSWSVDFQREPTNVSRPTIMGWLAIRSAISPEQGLFGGFDYGKFGQPKPVYTSVTVHTPSELNMYNPLDPEPELLAKAYENISACFDTGQGTLFEPALYVPGQ